MTRFDSLRPAGVLLVAVAILALPDCASAEERSHHSRGTAQFVGPTQFVGAGEATHLGRYTEVGGLAFGGPSGPATITLTAWSVYTAANGDQLYAVFDGELNLTTGAITATVTYFGGTGRFDDAGGSATLSGQLLPGGTIAVAAEGTIDY